MKTYILLAGVNGAGKSTLYNSVNELTENGYDVTRWMYYDFKRYSRCFRQCYPSKRSQKYVLELIINLLEFLKYVPRNPLFYRVF